VPKTLKIAILGWGSLVWDPQELRIVKDWVKGGPDLPIELSRLSDKRGHLTYVIDERHERRSGTRFAVSRDKNLEDAIADLACREGCAAQRIGFVVAESGEYRSRTKLYQGVKTWAQTSGFDAVLWTDLEPKFPGEWGVSQAVKWWNTKLEPDRIEDAKTYATRAPKEVDTDLRRRLVDEKLIPPAQGD